MPGLQATSVIDSLRALSSELDRLDEVAAQVYGLNRTDMRALEVIGRTGPLAPSALARVLGFTTGGITTVIDRLEHAGYVQRQPDPADRRRLIVAATSATSDQDRAVFGPLMQATADLLRPYGQHELGIVTAFLQGMRDVTADFADTLAAHGS